MSCSNHRNSAVRSAQEGGASRIRIPFGNDAFQTVTAREGHSFKHGPGGGFVAPINPQKFTSSDAWEQATDWLPPEDDDFALDPNGSLFEKALKRSVLKDKPLRALRLSSKKKKKNRSKLSVRKCFHNPSFSSNLTFFWVTQKRPNVVWRDLRRSAYLDEILRFAGRGDFIGASACPDCVAMKKPTPGIPEYRCESDCFLPDLTCKDCCVRRHKRLPFHRIQVRASPLIDSSISNLHAVLEWGPFLACVVIVVGLEGRAKSQQHVLHFPRPPSPITPRPPYQRCS